MHRPLVTLLVLTFLTLPACAGQSLNPFASSSSGEGEVVYSQFSDIPLPRQLKPSSSRSFVSYTTNGVKTGLETLEGSMDMVNLSRNMISNMLRDGWHLRATSTGADRATQLFEREDRYAMLYYYPQLTSMALEVWVVHRLADGAWQPDPVSPSSAPLSSAPLSSAPVSGEAVTPPGATVPERNLP